MLREWLGLGLIGGILYSSPESDHMGGLNSGYLNVHGVQQTILHSNWSRGRLTISFQLRCQSLCHALTKNYCGVPNFLKGELASVTAYGQRANRMMETEDQDKKNLHHHLRSFFVTHPANVRSPSRQTAILRVSNSSHLLPTGIPIAYYPHSTYPRPKMAYRLFSKGQLLPVSSSLLSMIWDSWFLDSRSKEWNRLNR